MTHIGDARSDPDHDTLDFDVTVHSESGDSRDTMPMTTLNLVFDDDSSFEVTPDPPARNVDYYNGYENDTVLLPNIAPGETRSVHVHVHATASAAPRWSISALATPGCGRHFTIPAASGGTQDFFVPNDPFRSDNSDLRFWVRHR